MEMDVDTQRCLLYRILDIGRFGHFFYLADGSNLYFGISFFFFFWKRIFLSGGFVKQTIKNQWPK